MDQSIEPKILPLVEVLNSIDGVRILTSSQGHFRGTPCVLFVCPLDASHESV